MATKPEHKDTNFTVFIRLPFPRGDFVDPPPVRSSFLWMLSHVLTDQVEWNAAKDQALWDVLSRPSKGDDIDCMSSLNSLSQSR